mmetsp:Transcript_44210/g.47897  ORF Transcript_44210/g.47897 Transcript_44210/m.47897 type:complete len:100 (-) Transcript_44210:21-320(-)
MRARELSPAPAVPVDVYVLLPPHMADRQPDDRCTVLAFSGTRSEFCRSIHSNSPIIGTGSQRIKRHTGAVADADEPSAALTLLLDFNAGGVEKCRVVTF